MDQEMKRDIRESSERLGAQARLGAPSICGLREKPYFSHVKTRLIVVVARVQTTLWGPTGFVKRVCHARSGLLLIAHCGCEVALESCRAVETIHRRHFQANLHEMRFAELLGKQIGDILKRHRSEQIWPSKPLLLCHS